MIFSHAAVSLQPFRGEVVYFGCANIGEINLAVKGQEFEMKYFFTGISLMSGSSMKISHFYGLNGCLISLLNVSLLTAYTFIIKT